MSEGLLVRPPETYDAFRYALALSLSSETSPSVPVLIDPCQTVDDIGHNISSGGAGMVIAGSSRVYIGDFHGRNDLFPVCRSLLVFTLLFV